MNETEIIEVIRQSILVTIQISAPCMLVGLLVGVAISLVQALTQIQEMTLAFVPKILAIFASLFVLLPFMVHTLIEFTNLLADRMIGLE